MHESKFLVCDSKTQEDKDNKHKDNSQNKKKKKEKLNGQ